jgi:hypothetical protein
MMVRTGGERQEPRLLRRIERERLGAVSTDHGCVLHVPPFRRKSCAGCQLEFGQICSYFNIQYNNVASTFRFVPTDIEEFALLVDPAFRKRTVFNSSRNAAMCSAGTVDSILAPGLGFLVTWGVALRAARAEA